MNSLWHTVKPPFIHVLEISTRFARASSSRIFLATNQSSSYGCYDKKGLDKVWSQTLFVANQFIGSTSLNKDAANKGWFTVSMIFEILIFKIMNFNCILRQCEQIAKLWSPVYEITITGKYQIHISSLRNRLYIIKTENVIDPKSIENWFILAQKKYTNLISIFSI